MKIRILYGVFAVSFVIGALSVASLSQSNRGTSATKRQTLLAMLPASDAVALVKVKRVLDDALPKLLSGNTAKLAEVQSSIERFKIRTGLDPGAFDELALGMRYSYPAEGLAKIDMVAVARGNFNAGAMIAAGRGAATGKYREEKYQGRTVYIFTLDQELKLLGLIDVRIRELAVCPLDRNTLALGDAKSVRGAIDANKGSRGANADLIALASQNPNAIIGFGGNISPSLFQSFRISNDSVAQDLAAVKQVYGSLGLTDKDLEVMVAARTLNANSARSLSDTVEGLKQFGALFINQLSAKKGTLARSALANLKITTQGNELQIRTAVAQADVAPLMGGF